MAFKFYLDGQLTDQPMNDTDLSTSIKRDRQLNNLLVTQDVELEYNGNNAPPIGAISGYTYLSNLFYNGACNEVTVEIYDEQLNNTSSLYYSGIIKIPSVKIDLQKAVLKTKIQDNSFYAYINNNKNLEVDLSANLTKSQLPLTTITKYSLDMFNQSNCIYGSTLSPPALYEAYLVYDVFDLLVRAISDNKVSFASTFLNQLSIKPFLCKGQDLLNSYTLYPNAQPVVIKLTFEKLFNEMRKLYNVFFWIDTNDIQNPILRLESYDGSFDFNVIYNFNDIKELDVSIDSQSLASKVTVGASKNTSGLFDNGLSYYGWKEEEFYPLGQCNIDNEFNLVNEFIIDTNSIQDIMIGQTTDLIDDIFIIQCDNVDDVNKTAIGYQYDILNDGGCYYNGGINNFNKVDRFSNQFVTTFGNFNGLGGYDFKASIGSIIPFSTNNVTAQTFIPGNNPLLPGSSPGPISYTTYGNVIYSNETTNGNFDNGGYYNSLNGRYTIPADGTYNFVTKTSINITGCPTNLDSILPIRNFWKFNIRFHLYDASNVLKYDAVWAIPNGIYQGASPTSWNYLYFDGDHTVSPTFVVNAIATDYAVIFFELGLGMIANSFGDFYGTPILNVYDASFTTIATPTSIGGGGGGSGNNNANKYLYEFDYDIPQSDFVNLLKNVTNQIKFEKDGITRFGWIESMKRNDWNGLTQIKLITRNAATSQ